MRAPLFRPYLGCTYANVRTEITPWTAANRAAEVAAVGGCCARRFPIPPIGAKPGLPPVPRRAAPARRAHRRQPAAGAQRRRQGDEAELCAPRPGHHVQPERRGLGPRSIGARLSMNESAMRNSIQRLKSETNGQTRSFGLFLISSMARAYFAIRS